jgi:dihydropteroate synthase type 2
VEDRVNGRPRILGVVNLTVDSFSGDGLAGNPGRAFAHAGRLLAEGADAIDLGAAASNPDAQPVSPAGEIARLEPLVERLHARGRSVSVDSFAPEVQRWALERGVAMLNDIQGFPDPSRLPGLARSEARLVVMHAVQDRGKATRVTTDPATIVERVVAFLEERVRALVAAGVARERLILDPGMGFFLGANPEPSLAVLRAIPRLKQRLGLPLLISVSRKSFLGALTGREAGERGAATLAAELWAARAGADWIRTHEVGPLADGLRTLEALEGTAG